IRERGRVEDLFLHSESVRCLDCANYRPYPIKGLEPVKEALGMCLKEPWDGFKTQWPLLRHPCKQFSPKS
ncbi:MAG: hypothetical protein ACK4WB_09095, partial [Desulfatiglandales bacterium]